MSDLPLTIFISTVREARGLMQVPDLMAPGQMAKVDLAGGTHNVVRGLVTMLFAGYSDQQIADALADEVRREIADRLRQDAKDQAEERLTGMLAELGVA